MKITKQAIVKARVDLATDATLEKLARRNRAGISDLVREAIADLIKKYAGTPHEETA